MKRLFAVLGGLLVLPAFAEVMPIFYDDVIEYSDVELTDDAVADDADNAAATTTTNAVAPAPAATSRTNTGRTTASRAVASSGARTVAPTRTVTSRGTASRTTSAARTATTTTAGTNTATAPVASRAGTARATVARPSATNSAAAVTVTPRRNTATSNSGTSARAALSQTDTVNNPLYISNSATTAGTNARVGTRSTGNVSTRTPTIRTGSGSTFMSDVSVNAVSTTDMDELAQVTDFCKAQYMQCMDNFCNVLDENQGRCSCSANLKNYATTEAALEKATAELQDVAQKIQYIGLTSDDVESLFTQTEAELTMQGKTDTTQLKNDLDKIKNLIVDVKSGSSSSSGVGLDMSGLLDFSISSTGFDLSSLLGNTANTSSISNQRGDQLYKTASARCKASVLNSCQAQGVDISLITNAYDLEIDKHCIQYERNLADANDQMTATVRNAQSVLQKARLMVTQQKNQYDLRGCVTELDNCMQDDFVCGTDYENCLDPTGKYIANGEVIVGSTPGQSGVAAANLYEAVWQYSKDNKDVNVWSGGNINDYVNTISNAAPNTKSTGMLDYLRAKIGYIKDGKAYGMCAGVLNKCQDLTFTGNVNNKSFKYDNEVIKQYMQRTLVQIKARQDTVLADMADSCMSDVASCLSQSNYNYGYNNTSGNTLSNVAVAACDAIINTCRSVTGTEKDGSNDTYKNLTNYQWAQQSFGYADDKSNTTGGN